MEEGLSILEQNIKNIFKENMVEFAHKQAKGDRVFEAKLVGHLTNFIVLSDFAKDLAALLSEGGDLQKNVINP